MPEGLLVGEIVASLSKETSRGGVSGISDGSCVRFLAIWTSNSLLWGNEWGSELVRWSDGDTRPNFDDVELP